MQTNQLLQSLAGYRLAEAERILGVDIGRQNDVPRVRQRADQIGKAAVVALFDVRVAWPAVHAHVIQRTTGVRAMEDDDHGKWAVAPAGYADQAVEAHRHVTEATVLRKTLLDDGCVAQVVLDRWRQGVRLAVRCRRRDLRLRGDDDGWQGS